MRIYVTIFHEVLTRFTLSGKLNFLLSAFVYIHMRVKNPSTKKPHWFIERKRRK